MGPLMCVFFFKQKTAYEIMPSLVGSEMCIRDRNKCPVRPGLRDSRDPRPARATRYKQDPQETRDPGRRRDEHEKAPRPEALIGIGAEQEAAREGDRFADDLKGTVAPRSGDHAQQHEQANGPDALEDRKHPPP